MPSSETARKPPWLKVKAPGGARYLHLKELTRKLNLHTVCEEALCPNIGECWSGGTATLMLMGDTCTRACRFCHIKTAKTPPPLDPEEPQHTADAIKALELDYVVLTSVDRDDLPDQGAGHFAESVRRARELNPATLIEVLIPDFQGDRACLDTVALSGPDVIGQNIETVERLTYHVRDKRAGYGQTLDVLRYVKEAYPKIVTKSAIQVGLGESDSEIEQTMKDLRAAGVQVLTVGQYLRPTQWHLPVERFVTPAEFEGYKTLGESLGFLYVASGPLVRSSYKAGEYFLRSILGKAHA